MKLFTEHSFYTILSIIYYILTYIHNVIRMMGKVERKKGRKKDEREIISSNFCELVFLLFFKLQLLLSKCKKRDCSSEPLINLINI